MSFVLAGKFCSSASPAPAEPLILCSLDKVIQERKESLKDEREFEKIQKKRYLDFLDILLCAKVSDIGPLCWGIQHAEGFRNLAGKDKGIYKPRKRGPEFSLKRD